MSFVVAKKDMKAALLSIHREFQLERASNSTLAEPETHYQCFETLQTSHSVDQGK